MKELKKIENKFPIFQNDNETNVFSYLDSAATTQKPNCVIETVNNFYKTYNANVHRGIYQISQKATEAYEDARKIVANFIHAPKTKEVIFTSGTTESINLVASSFAPLRIRAGDEILISEMEHHSNIVPWQLACKRLGAILKVIPVTDRGELSDTWLSLLSKKTKLLAITHVSNVLGTINPIKKIITEAHRKGIPVLVDGAQAVAHIPVDVHDLDCDFYVFSGHKMYAPTGIGILYAKSAWLNAMPPYQSGGEMIMNVTFKETSFADIPYKFEAGTQNIAGVIGLGCAVKFLNTLSFSDIQAHEQELLQYTIDKLSSISGLTIIGMPASRIGVVAFTIKGVHPHDVASILDTQNVAVRAGHHCAQPLHHRFGLSATTRVSLGVYNTKLHIDRLVEGLQKVKQIFR